MSERDPDNFRDHLVAGARDILVISAVISLLATIAVALSRPYWQPFAEMPIRIERLYTEVSFLQSSLNDRLVPRIVDFQGIAPIVANDIVRPGGNITVLYYLRRNAACDTELVRGFYEVDTGSMTFADRSLASEAPVTEDFILFKVDVAIPANLKPGRYVYAPKLRPVDCGVYQEITIPPTQIFEVTPLR